MAKANPDNIISFSDLSPNVAIKKLREIATDTSEKVFFSSHATKRMKQRKISRTQVFCCLKHGQIDEGPYRNVHGAWQMRMSVKSAGEIIQVVAVLDYDDETGEHSVILTVFGA